MMQYIVPATGLLFTLENILWINIGVFVGSVFAAIPGLSVILCVILFLPVTYTMTRPSPGHDVPAGHLLRRRLWWQRIRHPDQYAGYATRRGHHAGRPSSV